MSGGLSARAAAHQSNYLPRSLRGVPTLLFLKRTRIGLVRLQALQLQTWGLLGLARQPGPAPIRCFLLAPALVLTVSYWAFPWLGVGQEEWGPRSHLSL